MDKALQLQNKDSKTKVMNCALPQLKMPEQ
jgi:hypothetical protein